MNFRYIDLFAGIGGIRIPFDRFGGECVFSSEWDLKAQETYEANFGERPSGDITKIHENDVPDHDILLAGFPCQPFSIMGEQKGFSDTRGTLFFDILRILETKRPEAFLLENVKQLRSHDGGRTFETIVRSLEELGYTIYTRVLNSMDYGVPQKRERTIFVGFREALDFVWPRKKRQMKDLSLILERDEDVCPSLFASEEIQRKRLEKLKGNPPVPSIWHENKSGNISALPYSCALRAGASYNYLLVNGRRRLSSREMLRLQGFPDTFKIVVGYSHMRKQTGNAVTVDVIDAVGQEMMRSLSERREKKRHDMSFQTELFGDTQTISAWG